MPFHDAETIAVGVDGYRSYHQSIHPKVPDEIQGDYDRPTGKRILPVPNGTLQRAGLGKAGKRINNSAHARAVEERLQSETVRDTPLGRMTCRLLCFFVLELL